MILYYCTQQEKTKSKVQRQFLKNLEKFFKKVLTNEFKNDIIKMYLEVIFKFKKQFQKNFLKRY